MRSLFLGLGKVNLSLAKHIPGEKWGFVEGEEKLIVSKADAEGGFQTVKEVEGGLDDFDWTSYLPARVFLSPGIDPRREFFSRVADYEVKELSFFCSRFAGKIIAITGTDGKSTFTLQLGEVLKRAFPERKIFVGGNLGIGMCEGLSGDYDLAVLEVSSFQTERLRGARVDLGIILNLDIDHLDRYDRLEDYHGAKWNLLKFARDVCFPNDVSAPVGFQRSMIDFTNREELRSILTKLVGAMSTSPSWGFEFAPKLLENLPRLRHRLERFDDVEGGRTFVNDSKATTVHATAYGLKILQAEFPSIKLILGGKYKGDDFTRLLGVVRPADQLLLCGEASQEIRGQTEGFRGVVRVYPSLAELLKVELPLVLRGDCLLLSPACSSYDEFNNFEERGDFFLRTVGRV